MLGACICRHDGSLWHSNQGRMQFGCPSVLFIARFYFPFFSIFAHVSRNVTALLNTNFPAPESGSTQ